MKDKFTTIKIRTQYRDMIKQYSAEHGYKMYALLEVIIEEKCKEKRILYSNKN